MSNFAEWSNKQDFTQAAAWPTASTEDTMKEPAPVEPTVEENANMIRQAGEWLAKKAVEASGLAKRVAELENAVETLKKELTHANEIIDAEFNAHAETKRRLSAVEADLAKKETVVHDLVMERDIALGERNAAQGERDYERSVVNGLRNDNDILNSRLQGTEHANAVLHERCERMAEHIRAFKSAYAALSEAA